jgi:ATP-dependent exoDNAse (exonuclease V) beta subunit
LNTYPENKGGETTYRDQLKNHFQRVVNAQRISEIDSEDLVTFLERYGEALKETCQSLEVIYYAPKSVTLDASEVAAARRILHALISLAMRTAIKRTKALYTCLTGFERAYDAEVRCKGLLSFTDYVVLLNKWLAPLERKEQVEALLEDIHFRLDAKVSHWLLDEFQDTSTRQYDVLRRNIDEIVGQGTEDRSVFVVGDTKQSLYEWRAGNRELLNRVDAMIKETGVSAPMDETRRCCPQVLAMVNALLEHLSERGLGEFFSVRAAADWDKVYREQKAHAAAPKLGSSQWVRLTKPKADEGKDRSGAGENTEELESDMAERHAAYIAKDLLSTGLLAESADKSPRSLLPGVTCAVLVSKNNQARVIAESLRSKGIEATDEASVPVVRDNPVTAGLFALIEVAAHPDNGLAKGLAWMSPASRPLIESENGAPDWNSVTRKIAEKFAAHGAESVVDWLAGRVDEAEVGDFLAKRLRQFRAVAADYDATGRRDLSDFISYADGTHLRDMATINSVQVITIHRSKGLEYGMVYMPCLNDSYHKMAEVRGNLLYMTPAMRKTHTASAGSIYEEALFRPDWLLAGMNATLAEHVPGLSESLDALKAENAYGSLCRLYVGMTRAKHRLVMITDRLGNDKMLKVKKKGGVNKDFFEHPSNHGSHDFACFLESSLSRAKHGKFHTAPRAEDDTTPEVVWTDGAEPGSMEWIKAFQGKVVAKPAETPIPDAGWGNFTAAVRPLRRKPSSHEPRAGAPWAKASSELRGKHFGSYLHDLFARLERDADAFLSEIEALQAGEGQGEVHAQAVERIRACLKNRDIRSLLVDDLKDKLLWVERKAAIHQILPGGEIAIVPAVFDRVHVTLGKEALILDYKTATGRSDAYLKERYTEQMTAYREAVARLTGIPAKSIHAKLIGIQPDRLSVVEIF